MHSAARITADDARSLLPGLSALLQDAVNHGASVGFLRPLDAGTAADYWQTVINDVAAGSRVLMIAKSAQGDIAGSVQLGLCTKPNALHRAELQKLLVHTRFRRQGLAHALMSAIEREARVERRTLLHLDTEPGQPAYELYMRSGWIRGGEIPDYACTPDGQLHTTVIFHRRI